MQKRQKEAEIITAITAELDEMSFMFWLHDMGKCIWFKQFEREDTVEQATQFEYTHSVEFSAGTASFSDLSIDHEDKKYILNFEAFTVAPSRYQFSVNATPFDVKERVLELVIALFCCCFKYNGTPTKGRLLKAVRINFNVNETLLFHQISSATSWFCVSLDAEQGSFVVFQKLCALKGDYTYFLLMLY